jgi:hypothetical protein
MTFKFPELNTGTNNDAVITLPVPEQCAQQRLGVGPHRETWRPLVLGLSAHHIHLH